MMPLKEGLTVFRSVIKFCKFVGIPTTLLLAGAYWLLVKLPRL
jgi:hypothetical protein